MRRGERLRWKERKRNVLFLKHLEWWSAGVFCNVNIGSEGLEVEGCDAEQNSAPRFGCAERPMTILRGGHVVRLHAMPSIAVFLRGSLEL